jgi:hypothetical protein
VYDVDETALSAEQNNTQSKTTNELTSQNIDAILVPKFTEAVKYGLEALKMSSFSEPANGKFVFHFLHSLKLLLTSLLLCLTRI